MKLFFHGGGCGDSCCLRVQNLSVKIGTEQILHDVNMHVHCGELVALIGPNGAGKSTFLKAVLGQRDYDGVIAFSAPGQRDRRPRIGYVPQSPTFDPGDPVSVADLFSCCMSKRPAFLGLSKAMRNKVLECLERVHGEDLIDKRVGTLSGGELQRVLLALALEPLPNILILDEPLSGVDVEGMGMLMDMLDEIRKTYDLSILITTHDFSILDKYADQVVLIDHTVLHQGKPQEVLNSEAFANTFHRRGGATV
ncbi:MAG: metal ABC transporter ATP-binding protein [Oscillospiraceae bacterium]|nr:metal ABC transporter ATP-binding protein [Oscillospiraceae bacterium]